MKPATNQRETHRLSIVMPVYNERAYLSDVLARVEAARLPDFVARQIVLVDDASTDGTTDLLRTWQRDRPDLKICFHETNQGKGAAIATGIAHADGNLIVIQDADLEYDPADLASLIEPILAGEADVVYGSRFSAGQHSGWHRTGNGLLTMLSNLFTGLKITDMECCYKMFKREMLEGITLEEKRFGFEPEITAKMARRNARILERPVSYAGRSYSEGKKIGPKDGLSALRCIIKYGLRKKQKM